VTTINETVDQSLRQAGYEGYSSYARPVVTALVSREQEIAGRLIEYAQRTDLNVDAVREALTGVGMHMPQAAPPAAQAPPRPAPAGFPTEAQAPPATTEGDIGTVLGRIEETLSGLVGFARENGYRG